MLYFLLWLHFLFFLILVIFSTYILHSHFRLSYCRNVIEICNTHKTCIYHHINMYWNFDLKREYPKASNPAIPFYDVFKKDINIPVHDTAAWPMYESDCTIECYFKRTLCVVKTLLLKNGFDFQIAWKAGVKGTDLKLTAYIRYAWTRDVISYLYIVFDIFVWSVQRLTSLRKW